MGIQGYYFTAVNENCGDNYWSHLCNKAIKHKSDEYQDKAHDIQKM